MTCLSSESQREDRKSLALSLPPPFLDLSDQKIMFESFDLLLQQSMLCVYEFQYDVGCILSLSAVEVVSNNGQCYSKAADDSGSFGKVKSMFRRFDQSSS